jgi:SnoaL-like domain
MADEKLRTLMDRAAIGELMQRYGMSIDTRDWSALRSCFADEIEIDNSDTSFGRSGPPLRISGDKWLHQIRRIVSKFAVTQHMISPYRIEIEGDRAVCLSYLQARHFPPNCADPQMVWAIGGYYTNQMVRTPGGWKIAVWKLTLTWQENPPDPQSVAPDSE